MVEDGAIVGSQDIPGNGGIVITDKQYGDFEVIVEMRNDYGPDSGLFLRSTERGVAYQYLVDYHQGGSLAGLYGEGFRRGFHERNYSFGDKPSIITEVANDKNPLPINPRRFCGQNVHPLVELERICIDDFAANPLCQRKRKSRLSRGSRTHNEKRSTRWTDRHSGILPLRWSLTRLASSIWEAWRIDNFSSALTFALL